MSDDERERPKKIRFSKLQEAQLQALVDLERATTAMYYEIGFDGAEVPARTFADLAALPRTHSVHVAEADYQVAGYAAWRDESPGVAYIDEISVHPDYQRFGIGRSLYEKVEAEARDLKLKEIVLKVSDRAVWALRFYRALGFQKIEDGAPARVKTWFEEKSSGQPFLRPAESAMWVAIRPAAKVEDEDDEPEAGEDGSDS
jgi:ribosomal protein S18 acetylase RimI-like enzyme